MQIHFSQSWVLRLGRTRRPCPALGGRLRHHHFQGSHTLRVDLHQPLSMSWHCFARRKRQTAGNYQMPRSAPASKTSHHPPLHEDSKPLETSPTLKSSRLTLLSRIERAFLSPDSPSRSSGETVEMLATPSDSPSVWCITSYTGAPALAVSEPFRFLDKSHAAAVVKTDQVFFHQVQLPSPLRPRSILVYDRDSFSSQNISVCGSKDTHVPVRDSSGLVQTHSPVKRGIKRQSPPAMLYVASQVPVVLPAILFPP